MDGENGKHLDCTIQYCTLCHDKDQLSEQEIEELKCKLQLYQVNTQAVGTK